MFLFHLTLFQRLTLAFNTHQSCDLCDLCILSDMWRRLPRHHSFLMFLCFSWVSGLLCFWCYFSKSSKNSWCSYTTSPSLSNNSINRYIVISHCLKYQFSRKSSNILPWFCHVANHQRNSPEKSWDALTFFFELGIQVIQPQSIKNWTMNDMITTQWLHLKVFWLRIPQVDDLTRLKVVGTRLANFNGKKHVWLGKFGAVFEDLKFNSLGSISTVKNNVVSPQCLSRLWWFLHGTALRKEGFDGSPCLWNGDMHVCHSTMTTLYSLLDFRFHLQRSATHRYKNLWRNVSLCSHVIFRHLGRGRKGISLCICWIGSQLKERLSLGGEK